MWGMGSECPSWLGASNVLGQNHKRCTQAKVQLAHGLRARHPGASDYTCTVPTHGCMSYSPSSSSNSPRNMQQN
eukprot:6209642-Amphidinium_carterae.1